MFLNRSKLSKILDYNDNPNALIPKPVKAQKALRTDDDLSPKEIFLSIVKDMNKLSNDGKKKDLTKKAKKKITTKLMDFFKDQFPLISENDEDIFD